MKAYIAILIIVGVLTIAGVIVAAVVETRRIDKEKTK